MSEISDKLAELDREAEEAAERWRAARDRSLRDPWPRVRDAVGPLSEYFDAVRFRKREPDPEEERRLTAELLEKVTRNGLVVRPIEAGNAGMVEIFDAEPSLAAVEADRALVAARRARDTFARENMDALAAEADRAQMERLRESLSGDDPDAFRAALAGG